MAQAYISTNEAVSLFKVSRRTIGRRLGDPSQRGINTSQVVQDGLEKRIAFAELVRVFGEPKGRPTDMGTARIDSTTRDETPRQPSEDRTEELIAELRERLAETKERAERYEQEAIELRRTNAALVAQFLPAATSTAPKAGFFGRWFGG